MTHESVRVRSAALLRELRMSKGLSLRDMAERLPINKSRLSALENSLPNAKTCPTEVGERIAEVLGVSTGVLFAPAPSVKRGRPSVGRGQVAA